jgi:methionyl-tRNA synthetase
LAALLSLNFSRPPPTHLDKKQNKQKTKQLDISYDAFVRTTDAAHEAVVRELLERAWTSNAGAEADGSSSGNGNGAPTTTTSGGPIATSSSSGVVYRAAYTGYYCVGCEEYKDESEMVEIAETHPGAGATCCPVHRAPCVQRNEVRERRGGRRGAWTPRSARAPPRSLSPALFLTTHTHTHTHTQKPTTNPPKPTTTHNAKQDNYFFALTKFQREIEELLSRGGGGASGSGASPPEFVVPSARRNEVLGWVKEGLRDFSISRAKVKWGVPLPRDPSQTAYVWFDALAGYLTGTLAAAEAEEGESGAATTATATTTTATPLLDRLPSAGWPADVHVVGKDILRFHAVYWPGMLSAAGLEPPRQILGHGFLTKDGLKMGKSLGNTLDPAALTSAYGPDAVRFWLMKEVALGSDGNFREAGFRDTVNAGLANTVGNLLNRTLGMLHKYYPGGGLPATSDDATLAPELRAAVEKGVQEAAEAYDRLAPHQAVEAVLAAAVSGNRFLEEAAPWTALKKGTDEEKREAGRALVAALEAARVLAAALYPVTPALAGRVWQQLNAPGPALDSRGEPRATWEGATRWGQLTEGHVTAAPEPVFLRIDDATTPYVAEVVGEEAKAAAAGGKKGGGGGKQQKQQQPKKKKKEEAAAAAGAAAA